MTEKTLGQKYFGKAFSDDAIPAVPNWLAAELEKAGILSFQVIADIQEAMTSPWIRLPQATKDSLALIGEQIGGEFYVENIKKPINSLVYGWDEARQAWTGVRSIWSFTGPETAKKYQPFDVKNHLFFR